MITLIILTSNEESHIKRCVESAKEIVTEVFVIDCYSTDRTLDICKSLGVKVIQHKWEGNQAKQFNWALENINIKTKWVMRLDADEYLLPELVEEIRNKLDYLDNNFSGVYLIRRVYFMNQWIKHGGYYPIKLLRIWLLGSGKFEERWMDEHVKLNHGNTIVFENDFVDDNINNLTWWTNKHNNYSTREAIDLLNIKYGFNKNNGLSPKLDETQDKKKRWLKEKIYSKIPLFVRPFIYFIYRYFIKLGFLDGVPGIIWHFLQGFWYRFLVDAKVYDIERRSKMENKSIPEIIKERYGIEI